MSDGVIGVDLGGTKIEFGLVDPENRIVARRRIPTHADDGPQAVVERIAQTVDELKEALPGERPIAALGICCPGPLDHETGTLINPTNLPKFYNTPLRQMLSDRLGLPVSLEHDAKAAALGEFHYGTGRDEQSMVYIVVGTGVGAAIIVDGQVYRGVRNFAGEVGHTTIDRHGELCACGSRGCVETYTSGPWLARRYQRALEQAGQEAGDAQPVTGEIVARLAEQGEPLASKIMAEAGEALGLAVAAMAMILDIDLYVFGGSVAKSGNLLLDPAREIVPKYSFQSVGPRIRIVSSELGEDAPILGCAWLARQAGSRS